MIFRKLFYPFHYLGRIVNSGYLQKILIVVSHNSNEQSHRRDESAHAHNGVSFASATMNILPRNFG